MVSWLDGAVAAVGPEVAAVRGRGAVGDRLVVLVPPSSPLAGRRHVDGAVVEVSVLAPSPGLVVNLSAVARAWGSIASSA